MFGEILNKKYIKDETGVKLATIIQNMSRDPALGGPFKTVFDNVLSAEAKERMQLALNFVPQ